MQIKHEKNNEKNDFFQKKLAAHPCEANQSNQLTIYKSHNINLNQKN